MTQLSRPYQIALVTLALFALVWFVALHRTSSSSGGSGASPAASSAPAAPTAAAEAKAAAAPTRVYHGPAPGVEGLTRAINKAHGAVAQSQREARRVETSEPSTSSSSTTTTTTTSSSSSSSSASHVASHASAHAVAPVPVKPAHQAAPPAVKHAMSTRSMQDVVEKELQQGKTVLILFWNRHSSVDVAVRNALASLQRSPGERIAVHYASAGQVGAFGTVTHAVQVTQTPTLLIVNRRGQTTVLTGLNDAFAIQQAISESRHS